MNTNMATFAATIDVNQLEYKGRRPTKTAARWSPVSTKLGSSDPKYRLAFQMSPDEKTACRRPWGLSQPMAGQDASRRTLELSIESEALLKFLTDLDERNVKAVPSARGSKTLDEDGAPHVTRWCARRQGRPVVKSR